jgi:carboxyl-terminal processing protease
MNKTKLIKMTNNAGLSRLQPTSVISLNLSSRLILILMLCLQPMAAFTQTENITSKSPLDDALLENISLMAEVLARTQQEHLESPEAKELMYGAIRGMLRTLDPYSQFLEPKNYADFQSESRGSYGGLGMAIGIRNDRLTVISPFKDTPAYKAELQSGDVISEIDGESTLKMTVDDAVELLRGEPGAAVIITILREGESEPLEITLVRDVIRFRSVEEKIFKGNVGYIRINQFRDTTAEDVDKAFETFNQQEIHGIILDLRSNPGGLLTSAVEIASDFLEPEQLVVYTQGKSPREDFLSKPGNRQRYYPLVVLVNSGSASGSEIVAAAIKDHGHGLIMGTKTFGKASVQRVFPLSGGGAVKLTVAHYYSPNGVDIHKIGIAPDIESPWFSRSEQQMLSKLRGHEKIKAFIEANGDDILAKVEAAKEASRDDQDATALLRKYQRLNDSLAKEQIIISDAGLKLAIARETKNDSDEYEYDPQIVAGIQQLKAIEVFQSKLK